MRNIETRNMKVANNDALISLLNKARLDEKKDQHLAFSLRLEALSIHAQQKEFTATEIIELLHKEAVRFEHSAQELCI
ncbi:MULTISPECIES: DUF2732 family protein [Brenneria]|uniref:DUF2732 domain-containing protein n=1 Tax=Brenneria izadpanahii TaxID=2722756 RepID=A0ABX7UWF9_9GAMM|nr:DUF2732 family protein [Brenneria izadpanahii]QTF10046.1 DUF2732 domain-containing protein [Brenneria izadpanahii]